MCVINSISLSLSFSLRFSFFPFVMSLFPSTFVARCGIHDSTGIADSAVRTFLLRFRGPLFRSRAQSSESSTRLSEGSSRFSPALLWAKAVLFFVVRTASSASSTSTTFCTRHEAHDGVVQAAYRVIASKRRSALCLTLCTNGSLLLSAKAALPTKRDFNYRAMGFASGSQTYGEVYISRCRRADDFNARVFCVRARGVLRNAIIFCSRRILDFKIH